MIPETREQLEKQQDIPNISYRLQDYLRREASVEQLNNTANYDAMLKRLVILIKDYCLKYNVGMSEEQCNNLASYAIKEYLSNWQNKTPGEDNRGHVFGKV